MWRPGCSWGWENVAFVIEDGDGGARRIVRRERPWPKNAPLPYSLKPGEHFVWSVNLFDGTWAYDAREGSALDSASWRRKARMKVVYLVVPADESKKWGVWTGEAESAYEEYEFDVTGELSARIREDRRRKMEQRVR